jgi:nitrogen-specific signal transduction histidine kinase
MKPNTTVYTPIVEAVVNAIEAIDCSGVTDGKIAIRVRRSGQIELDGSLADITSFQIDDNGVGFTDEQRDSFDTLYSDLKLTQGGKGFGRFTYLKYFGTVRVESAVVPVIRTVFVFS